MTSVKVTEIIPDDREPWIDRLINEGSFFSGMIDKVKQLQLECKTWRENGKPFVNLTGNVENLMDHMAFTCECGSVHFNLLRSNVIECSSCQKRFGYWSEI